MSSENNYEKYLFSQRNSQPTNFDKDLTNIEFWTIDYNHETRFFEFTGTPY